jgi:hypothetical protein
MSDEQEDISKSKGENDPPPSKYVVRVDPQFWYEMSSGMVTDAIKSLREGAAKMEALHVWALGIFLASSIFTIEWNDLVSLRALVLLSLPVIFLVLSYWFTNVAQLPAEIRFNTSSWTQIKKAHHKAFQKSSKNLKLAQWFTFITLFSMSISLMGAFVLKNQKTNEIYLLNTIHIDSINNTCLITGQFPKESTLTVEIMEFNISDSTISDTLLHRINPKSGIYMEEWVLDSLTVRSLVTIKWSEKEYLKSLGREAIISSKLDSAKVEDSTSAKLFKSIWPGD